MASNSKQVPKDAQVIVSIMRDMGITDYEPKVVNQLLEFTYRYVTCILDDSKIYASHSKKKFIDSEDVRLAVQMQSENSFTNPPPREILLDVAKIKNNVPLPFVKPSYGLRLPPDRYCLNGTNYKLKTPSKKTGRMGIGNSHVSGGMNKGNTPSFSIIKRPTTLTAYSRSQTISVPKPIPKVTTSTAAVSTKPVIQQQVQPKMPTALDPGHVAMPTIKTEPEESLKRKREDDDYDVP